MHLIWDVCQNYIGTDGEIKYTNARIPIPPYSTVAGTSSKGQSSLVRHAKGSAWEIERLNRPGVTAMHGCRAGDGHSRSSGKGGYGRGDRRGMYADEREETSVLKMETSTKSLVEMGSGGLVSQSRSLDLWTLQGRSAISSWVRVR